MSTAIPVPLPSGAAAAGLAIPDDITAAGQLVGMWYQWGVMLGFVLALIGVAWIFLDSRQSNLDATIWKAAGAVGVVLVIPFLLVPLSPSFSSQVAASRVMLAYVSMGGTILSLVAAAAYTGTRQNAPLASMPGGGEFQPYAAGRQAPFGSPQGGLGMPNYGQPPYGQPGYGQPPGQWGPQAYQGGFGETEATQAAGSPSQDTVAASTAMSSETLAATGYSAGGTSEAPTMIIGGQPQAAFAWFVISTGPRAGKTLALKADGVTRIGRSAQDNDHTVDDRYVSRQHLSIRHKDGQFVLRDLDAASGTFVKPMGEADYRKVIDYTLNPNDVVKLGTTELIFMRVDVTPTPE